MTLKEKLIQLTGIPASDITVTERSSVFHRLVVVTYTTPEQRVLLEPQIFKASKVLTNVAFQLRQA